MEFSFNPGRSVETVRDLGGLTLLVNLGIMIFWMVVGWRAMKAHEKIAQMVERMAGKEVPTKIEE